MTPLDFSLEWELMLWDHGYIPLADGSWVHVADDMPEMSHEDARLDRGAWVATRLAQIRDGWPFANDERKVP